MTEAAARGKSLGSWGREHAGLWCPDLLGSFFDVICAHYNPRVGLSELLHLPSEIWTLEMSHRLCDPERQLASASD